MAISKNATVLEQSKSMYSLSDPNIVYWKDWAEKFIECCLELGWEVERGPGTSLGAVMFGTDNTTGENAYYIPTPQSSAWDCDWTQADGIVKEWQVDDTYNDYPKYTGWFKNFETWPTNANDYGIDEETGRFDFIVYTSKGENNERIGFRIKYPICSIGYSYGGNVQSSYAVNYIYGVPALVLYSSLKKDIDIFSPPSTKVTAYTPYNNIHNGYIYFIGKDIYKSPRHTDCILEWGKTDNLNTLYGKSYSPTDIVESPLWSLELQNSESFTKCPLDNTYSGSNTNRLFLHNWKRFNKFNYHFSETEDTVYLYVSDKDGNIAFKLITTTLENNEKAIIIERRTNTEEGTLGEMAAVTGNLNIVETSQQSNDYLIKLPKRPYIKNVSGVGKFAFSKMLIPTQISLCKDLYYVTRRDVNDSIKDGQYVWVKNKYSKKHYFRIIPFGSFTQKESLTDNTTYLAFPIVSPPTEGEDE